MTPTAITIDEWVSPYLNEDRPRVITGEMIDWGRSYISYDTVKSTLKKEERVQTLRTKYLLE